MALEWTQEEKVLLNMKKIIAVAWRMNRRQLCVHCKILRKKQAETLQGQIGSAFIEKLEWFSGSGMDAGTKIWPLLMQDTDFLLKIIQSGQNMDRSTWLTALSKLEANQGKYFKTELGMAFILELKEKTEMANLDKEKGRRKTVPAENGIRAVCINDKRELEKVATWLIEDTQKQNEKAGKKKAIFFRGQMRKAAVPALACLSACFMSVWLYGQLVRDQGRWSLQRMKMSESKETEAIMQENMGTAPETINHAERLADAGQPVKKIQIQNKLQAESRLEKLPQYRKMSEEYPQLYGWLQIPDTQIDLPVMRARSDRDFYLYHDFSGTKSAEGALFVDVQSSVCPQDNNTVIYGHNMKNGHMFGMLKMYGNEDFFQTHREIHFDTIYETGTYEAVALLKTRIRNENEQGFRYYQFFQYSSEDEFRECLDFVEDNCMFETGGTLQYGDRILMLSTCEYSQENGRLVVVTRKIKNM